MKRIEHTKIGVAPAPISPYQGALQNHIRLAVERLRVEYQAQGHDVASIEQRQRLAEVPLKLALECVERTAALLRSVIEDKSAITPAALHSVVHASLWAMIACVRWSMRRSMLAAGGNPFECFRCRQPTPDGSGRCAKCSPQIIDMGDSVFDRMLFSAYKRESGR